MERHIQSVLQALVVVALVWVGGTLQSVLGATIESAAAIKELKEQVTDIKVRYPTREEVAAKMENASTAHYEIGRRIDILEAKLEKMR